jgi:glycosyltransferase involved in cell wall biosynthesis
VSYRALLIGPSGHGGEGVYMNALRNHPPDGVEYDTTFEHHSSARGASCLLGREIVLNQSLYRVTVPDIGFRALRLKDDYDLVHAHAHPVLLKGLGQTPLVMSEGSSPAVYLGDYLGWSPRKLRTRFGYSRPLYRLAGAHDRLLNMHRANRVYVFSEWARSVNVYWGADPAKLEVIYPGFETPPEVSRERREGFAFLFVGRDFERKGGYEVLEAFDRLAGDVSDVRLIIAGSDLDKPNPDLQTHSWASPARRMQGAARLERLIAGGRVSFRTWVDQSEVRHELYPAADAFLMPTHAEGFGFTNIEAMSFGLPVITSSVGPAEEVVGHRRAGMLVAPGNVDQLVEAMHELVVDRSLARRLGESGRRDFLARFTRERFRAQLAALYGRTLAAG